MKLIRDQLDRVAPLFEKGGKLEKLYPLYEAGDTFLFTPGQVTKNAAHVRDSLDMKRMMIMVVIALVPCIWMALWNTGYQANLAIEAGAEPYTASISGIEPAADSGAIVKILGVNRQQILEAIGVPHDSESLLSNVVVGSLYFLPVYIVCMAVGGTCELIFSLIRGHEINEGFLVSGMLFPLTLPPTIPLWQVATGIMFGIVIGKEIFGGTGKNFLNPALTARAYLYFAHAPEISGDKVWTAVEPDGFTGATILGGMPTMSVANMPENPVANAGTMTMSWWDCFMGWIPGSMGETSALACLLGAGLLIATGIGSWRIMASFFAGGFAMAAILYAFHGLSDNPMTYIPPHWHFVIGSFAFGAVFMATDPVSAAMTETGKWWYGGLIGVMTILIRVINPAFAEGVMLAILFGNVMAPLIDYFVIQANVTRRAARYAT